MPGTRRAAAKVRTIAAAGCDSARRERPAMGSIHPGNDETTPRSAGEMDHGPALSVKHGTRKKNHQEEPIAHDRSSSGGMGFYPSRLVRIGARASTRRRRERKSVAERGPQLHFWQFLVRGRDVWAGDASQPVVVFREPSKSSIWLRAGSFKIARIGCLLKLGLRGRDARERGCEPRGPQPRERLVLRRARLGGPAAPGAGLWSVLGALLTGCPLRRGMGGLSVFEPLVMATFLHVAGLVAEGRGSVMVVTQRIAGRQEKQRRQQSQTQPMNRRASRQESCQRLWEDGQGNQQDQAVSVALIETVVVVDGHLERVNMLLELGEVPSGAGNTRSVVEGVEHEPAKRAEDEPQRKGGHRGVEKSAHGGSRTWALRRASRESGGSIARRTTRRQILGVR